MIRILDYQESWPAAFEELRECLANALSEFDVSVEHVGSTSVPGLASKAMLDIHVFVGPGSEIGAVIGRLGEIGYIHEGDLGVEGREAFRRLGPDVPFRDPKRDWYPHHLYASTSGNVEALRHIAFRDHLRADAGGRDAYEAHKRRLAEEHAGDADAYSEGKRRFMLQVLDRLRDAPATESPDEWESFDT
jgi:GrpB-like predicted nucleotidyltransferase (UPF0157 family)